MLHQPVISDFEMHDRAPVSKSMAYRAPVFAEIIGWGKCIPQAVLSNADLSTFLETTDEWIVRRTGIRSRPISHVPVSELAYVAAMHAIASSGVSAENLDLVVLGSCTADEQMPNTSSRIQRSIGAHRAAAVDINTACTSFMYALSYASALIRVGSIETALVIGADTLSAYMDWNDRRPSVVFGDGAGAVMLRATDEPLGIVAEDIGCVTSHRDVLRIKGMGTAYANAGVTYGSTEWDFDGREVFRLAVASMSNAAKSVLVKYGGTTADIDLVIPHQANLRIVEAVARRVGIPMDKFFVNLEKCGNLSSASIPVAFVDALAAGSITPHSTLLAPAFGGGMTWSSHIIKWGARVAPVATSSVKLSSTTLTGLQLVQGLRNAKGQFPGLDLPESNYSATSPRPLVWHETPARQTESSPQLIAE